jgi:hypothetical protein
MKGLEFFLKKIVFLLFLTILASCRFPGLEKSEYQILTEMKALLCFSSTNGCDGDSTYTNFFYSGSPFQLTTNTQISNIFPQNLNTANSNYLTVTPSLPLGLSLNSSTGMISGTPVEIQPETKYTITLNVSDKTYFTTISISVKVPTACSDVTITTGVGTGADPFIICNPNQLQSVQAHHIANPGANYKITQDLDLSVLANFSAIGSSINQFNGVFDGQNKTIYNLTVNFPGLSQIGLFGVIDTGSIVKNLILRKPTITGNQRIGVVVGESSGTIQYIRIYQGSVTGSSDTSGGVVGRMTTNSYTWDTYFSGTVTSSSNYVGGIVGRVFGGEEIKRSHANAVVTGDQYIGTIIGGLAGADVVDCYGEGTVSGTNYLGGLVGRAQLASSTITNSYSLAIVGTSAIQSGLVAEIVTAVTNSYYSIDLSNQLDNDTRGLPRTTSQLTCPLVANDVCAGVPIYVGWDPMVWSFGTTSQYPRLQWE